MWPASTSPGSSPPISTSWLYERLRRKREIQTVKLNLRMFGRSTYDLLLHFLWQQLICCSETRRRNVREAASTDKTNDCAERSFVHLRTSWLLSSDWTAGCDPPPPKETQSLNWTDLWVTLTAGQETLLFTLLLIEMGKIQHVTTLIYIGGDRPPPLPLIFKYGQNVPPIQRWSPAPSGGAPGPYFSKNMHRMNASWRSDRNLAWIKWSLSTHSRFPLFNTCFYNIYGGKVPPLPVPPCDLISVNKLPPSKKVISKYYLLL